MVLINIFIEIIFKILNKVIGKIASGSVNLGDKISSIDNTGKTIESSKVLKIIRRYGMQ
jgi:GTP-binding protein